MKVFVSSYYSDGPLARKVIKALKQSGLDVWDPEREILPGDNWAEKVAKGLEESDAMVVLLTPNALASGMVQHDISYALNKKDFNGRLIPVFVGSHESLPESSVPWIVRHLKTLNLPEHGQAEKELQQIAQALKEVA
jgi:hypothetical protein